MTKNRDLGEQTPKEDSPVVSRRTGGEESADLLSNHFMGNAVSHEQGKVIIDFPGVHDPVVVLVEHSVILGRGELDSPNEVSIDLKPYGASEMGVSRRHARLHRTTSIIYITDLNSRNGTLLNGERLLPHQARILRDEDEVQLGRLIFHVHIR
jgi:pSer/pThr/pTyr-binding forkhead associated (FHA) protein